jgi:hypothetical protein
MSSRGTLWGQCRCAYEDEDFFRLDYVKEDDESNYIPFDMVSNLFTSVSVATEDGTSLLLTVLPTRKPGPFVKDVDESMMLGL